MTLLYRYFWAVAPLTVCGSLFAQTPSILNNPAYQPPITIVSDVDKYNVQPDYSYQEIETRTIKMNSPVGVKQFSQIPLSYNPDLEKVTVLEAYTTKADGTKVPVDKSAILDRQSAASANAPMFNSDRVKTVIFADTAVGDTLTIKVQKDGKPLFPKTFSTSTVFPTLNAVEHAEVEITIPTELALHTAAPKMTTSAPTTKDGHKTWRWTLDKQAAIAPEAGMAVNATTLPAVFATTLPDWQAAANAYFARAKDKAQVTPQIHQQADKITAGINDKKAQAEAIYNWVSSNIRYVAVYFGAGGVVPHSAAEILQNRYGDCKDHVTLLQALLAAKGIDSAPVLVNANDYYGLPDVAVMPGVFNHVITYLPAWNLYLDSTAEVATFGVLPAPELGKPALLVGEKAQRVTLPLGTPENNFVISESDITLDANGGAKGSSKTHQQGANDWLVRMIAASIPHGMEAQVAQKYLQITGQSGTGNFQFGNPHQLAKPFTYQSTFTLRDIFDPQSDGAFRIPLGITAFNSIGLNTFGALTTVTKRAYPFVLNGNRLQTISHIHLPNNLTVSKLPIDVNFHNDLGSYQAHYSQKGNTITVTREMVINKKDPLTAVKDYPQLQALNEAINKDVRRQVLYAVK